MSRGYTLTQTGSEVQEILNDEPTKQDRLVSGENIKTINNQSILGPGNLNISGIDHEVDPTVPAWAKQPNKPSYTASEVGALPDTTDIPDDLADLNDDDTHRLVTDTEKSTWNNKQDSLTFDNVPTSGSDNPITSGGVYDVLGDVETLINAL